MRHLVLIGWLTAAACGLDERGLESDDAGTEVPGDSVVLAPLEDGSADSSGGLGRVDASAHPDGGSPDAPASSVDATSACPTVPAGWTLALYDLSNNSCPTRFTAHDVFGPPVLGAGACSCACTVTQPGSCLQGELSVTYGSSGGPCDTPTWTAAIDGGSCTVLGSSVVASGMPSNLANPLASQGGVCTQAARANLSLLQTPSARYCEVPADGASAVCAGTVPSGFAACIATSAETDCPPRTPFTQKHVVEDHVSLQCSACSGTCSVTTTCSDASVMGFTDSACTMPLASVIVDGACHPVMFYTSLPATLMAVEYEATPSSTCNSGSSTPSMQLTNPRTICCQ